jgi:hypothetical protein
MHNAPSVVYPVGRCAFQGWLLMVLGALSAAVVALFLVESDFRTLGVSAWLPGAVGVGVWLSWGTWACLSWFRAPQGSLRWEPRHVEEEGSRGAWFWADGAGSEAVLLGSVERVLDFQGRVLLRFCGPGVGHRWAWLERRSLPARWGDLRRALLASRA